MSGLQLISSGALLSGWFPPARCWFYQQGCLASQWRMEQSPRELTRHNIHRRVGGDNAKSAINTATMANDFDAEKVC